MGLSSAKPLPGATTNLTSWVSEVHDNIQALEGAWTDWSASFVLTAATTNPTKGNSTYNAGYLLGGKSCDYQWKFAPGTTFGAGSGVYNFPLPFTASAAQIARGIVAPVFMNVGGVRVGFGYALLTSAGTSLNIFWWNNTGSLAGPLDHTGPGHAWGVSSGDYLICNLRYEIA